MYWCRDAMPIHLHNMMYIGFRLISRVCAKSLYMGAMDECGWIQLSLLQKKSTVLHLGRITPSFIIF